jgi:hypothetical protein
LPAFLGFCSQTAIGKKFASVEGPFSHFAYGLDKTFGPVALLITQARRMKRVLRAISSISIQSLTFRLKETLEAKRIIQEILKRVKKMSKC